MIRYCAPYNESCLGARRRSFPIFCNIERPVKFQVLFAVIICESRGSFIVAAGKHSTWRLVFFDWDGSMKIKIGMGVVNLHFFS